MGQARTRTVSCARPRHGTPPTCRRAAAPKENHLSAGHLTRPTTSSRQNCTSNPRAAAQPQLPHGWVQWYQPVAMCSTALHYPSAPCQGTESRARAYLEPLRAGGWRGGFGERRAGAVPRASASVKTCRSPPSMSYDHICHIHLAVQSPYALGTPQNDTNLTANCPGPKPQPGLSL